MDYPPSPVESFDQHSVIYLAIFLLAYYAILHLKNALCLSFRDNLTKILKSVLRDTTLILVLSSFLMILNFYSEFPLVFEQ